MTSGIGEWHLRGRRQVEERLPAILRDIRSGMTPRAACEASGVDYQVFGRVRRQDRSVHLQVQEAKTDAGNYAADADDFDRLLDLMKANPGASVRKLIRENRARLQLPSRTAIATRCAADRRFAKRYRALMARRSEQTEERRKSNIDSQIEALSRGDITTADISNAVYEKARQSPETRQRLQAAVASRASVASTRYAEAKASRTATTAMLRDGRLLTSINRCLPRGLDPADQDDLRSELIAAAIAGEIRADRIAEDAKPYIKQARSMFAYSFLSLDMPLDRDDAMGATIGDMLTTETNWIS